MIVLAALLVVRDAGADQLVAGDALRIYYDSTGTMADQDAGAGLQVLHDGGWVDWVYPGSAWLLLAFSYRLGGEEVTQQVDSTSASATCAVSGEGDVSTADTRGSTYTYAPAGVELVQAQTWAADGTQVRVNYHVTVGAAAIERLALYFEVDPNPDAGDGILATWNDTVDTDGDGLDDLVVSASPARGYALGLGACDPSAQRVGHHAEWTADVSASPALFDGEASEADAAMGIQALTVGTLAPTEERDVTFALLEAPTVADLEAAWATSELCAACDGDADGHDREGCGGDDCDDESSTTFPGAADAWYDGVDADCSGGSDFDQDGDGFDAFAGGGDDCDDQDPAVNPGAVEVSGDGVDSDCDGDDPAVADSGTPDPGHDTGSPSTGGCGCAARAAGGELGVALGVALLVARRRPPVGSAPPPGLTPR